MATTVHIPDELLERVDEAASRLQLSRNRFIVLALRRAIETETQWSRDFLDALEEVPSTEEARAVDEMLAAITARRSSKRAPSL